MIAPLSAIVLSCITFGAVDGDTLRGCGERVRIWGIQAPERNTPAGPAATRAMATLISGKRVDCYPAPNGQVRDRYRRLVALCKANGKDIAAEMVKQGRARDYFRYSGGYYSGDRP